MIFDPCGRFPREQTTTTNLISATFHILRQKREEKTHISPIYTLLNTAKISAPAPPNGSDPVEIEESMRK